MEIARCLPTVQTYSAARSFLSNRISIWGAFDDA